MGYAYHLAPVSARFVREAEDLPPEALNAYILEKYSEGMPEKARERAFLWRLYRMPQIYLGGAAPKEASQYGKPLFNIPETQESFARNSPYVVNRRSVGALIEWWHSCLKEEEAQRRARKKRGSSETERWTRERLRLLRIMERRCSLFLLYVS